LWGKFLRPPGEKEGATTPISHPGKPPKTPLKRKLPEKIFKNPTRGFSQRASNFGGGEILGSGGLRRGT